MTIPMTDLFRFVNAEWLDTHEIPSDKASDGSFYQLRDTAEADVHAIMQAHPDTRAGRLFASFMDTAALNAAGVEPIREELDQVHGAGTIDELIQVLGDLERHGVGGPVGMFVEKDSEGDLAVVYLLQSGLGLPDEAYYREPGHAEIREAYLSHLTTMLGFLPEEYCADPAADAQRILALETAIAKGHWDVVRSRDAVATFNPMQLSALPGRVAAFLGAAGLPDTRVIASQPSFFEHLDELLDSVSLAEWKLWATWQVLHSRATLLTEEIGQANFDFYGTVLTGTTQQRDRWKRGLALCESLVGHDIGKLFVAEHFPPSSKEHMLELVDYLVRAYHERISALPWMTPVTREKALEKLTKFQAKIGYPETWRDYGDLDFSASGTDVVANVRAGSAYTHDYELAKVGKPADRSEWFTTPQTVNAFYNPAVNDITFPAAILRPPFFDPNADAAINFGAIGAVIGHEIGHGFDDQGSQYDGDGTLVSWWTEEDRQAFTALTAKLVDQFQGLVPTVLKGQDTPGVNGEFTLGENIGDLGGLGIAVIAYRLYLADRGLTVDTAPILPFNAPGASEELAQHEYTGLQRLFLSWSYVWRMKARPELAAQLLAVDPHSPGEFRCNVIAANVAEFYQAFEVDPEGPCYLPPADRVQIW